MNSKLNPPEIPQNIIFPIRMILNLWQRWYLKVTLHEIRKRHLNDIKSLNDTIETLTQVRTQIEKGHFNKAADIFNVAQYVLITQKDVTILSHDVLLNQYDDRRNIYCRMLAVTLIESVDGIRKVINFKFQKLIESVFNDKSLIEDIHVIRKEFSDFTKKYQNLLDEIRNSVAAHRDVNASKQLRIIKKIDYDQIIELSRQFVSTNDKMVDFSKKLLTILNNNKHLYLKLL